MSKAQSTQLKGIAILIMLFLHLFNHWTPGEYTPWFFIGERPLVYILSRACNPVGIFLMLSGYGLHYSYTHHSLTTKGQIKRLLRIYIYYWLILLIFVSIGHFVDKEKYPGSLWDILLNFLSLSNSYNSETWFLFPYALLSLTSPFIFRLIDKCGVKWTLFASIVLYFISAYTISRYIAPAKAYHTWYNFVLTYFDVQVSFVIGGAFHYYANKGKGSCTFLENKPWIAVTLLLLTFAINCSITSSALSPLFEFIYVFMLLHLSFSRVVTYILEHLGKQSMVMWLTHSFFCYHLFHDSIYGFKYPLLIFLVLLAVSYSVSYPITAIANQVICRIPFLQKNK